MVAFEFEAARDLAKKVTSRTDETTQVRLLHRPGFEPRTGRRRYCGGGGGERWLQMVVEAGGGVRYVVQWCVRGEIWQDVWKAW